MRMKLHSIAHVAVTLALLVVAAVPRAIAQGTDGDTRSVSGIVTNASGDPVPGAIVQLKDTKTLQIRSYVCQAGGRYHFTGLSTDVTYELRATFQGASSKTKRLSVFDGAKKPVIDLKLEK
jgi:hypothetical protein